ncbi:helix-turn-helix domain-containing protein [Paenibacillus sp. strain BS8-2]
MPVMDIPYELKPSDELPACKFHTIWKVHANNAYQVDKPGGFSVPGLFVTIEGTGSLTMAGEPAFLHAGTFFFVDTGIPCSYRCLNGDWKFYFIDFDRMDLVRSLDLPSGQVMTSARIPDAVKLCEQMIDNLIVQPVGYAYSAHHSVQALLLLFARERSDTRSSRYPELDSVLFRMHKNIDKPYELDSFIAESGLSRTAFFSRFRAMTGRSPARYMLELKLASAKASLETTNLSIKEIASALSFYDEFHFSKMFKQRYSVSPKAYRKGPLAK